MINYLAVTWTFVLCSWVTTAFDNTHHKDKFNLKSRVRPDLKCVSQYQGYVIELLWLLNPESTRGYYEFSEKLRVEYMPGLLQNISQAFPGSRAGVGIYGSRREGSCYNLVQPLTTNMATVAEALKTIEIIYGGTSPEMSLLGMALAASDPKVGWSAAPLIADGSKKKRIIKVLCLSTDDLPYPPDTDLEIRKPLTGTPSDNCSNANPSTEAFGKILNKNDIGFVGFVSEDILKKWSVHFEEMQTRGNIRTLNLDQLDFVVQDVMATLHDVICSSTTTMTEAPLATKTLFGAEDITNTGGGHSVAIISGASAGAVALVGTAAYLAYSYFSRSHSQNEGVPEDMIDVEESAAAHNREQVIVSGADAEHYL